MATVAPVDVNQNQLINVERSLGFIYPESFRSLAMEFESLCATPGFSKSFPSVRLILTELEIVSERQSMNARERLGLTGDPLPLEVFEKIKFSSATLIPFLRDEGSQWPDTYAFDLESAGPEYSVVVWSYTDPTIVQRWDDFGTFLQWLREHVASNEDCDT